MTVEGNHPGYEHVRGTEDLIGTCSMTAGDRR